jgi:hypothetical protein
MHIVEDFNLRRGIFPTGGLQEGGGELDPLIRLRLGFRFDIVIEEACDSRFSG